MGATACKSPSGKATAVANGACVLGDVSRTFSTLQKEIEAAIEKLKAAKDPFLRREFLRALRRLLDEAESAIELSIKPKAN